jgi:hypothetical protein
MINKVGGKALPSLVVLVAGLGVSLTVISPAQAAGENWAVYSTHLSPKGHDIPLRYGRHDNTGGSTTGFGKYHIDDGGHRYGTPWSSFNADIDQVLHNSRTTCVQNGTKWECTSHITGGVSDYGYGNMKVVYTHSDSGTPDGRPRGIITAYYLLDCGC